MGLRLRSHFHSFPWYCESPGKNLKAQEPWLDRIKTKTDKKKMSPSMHTVKALDGSSNL